MSGALVHSAAFSVETRADANPIVFYKGQRMEWDYYARPAPALHIVCPRCAKTGLIAHTNKRFSLDDRGRVSVDEPFRCDYCLWRFGVTDGVMFDAVRSRR